MIEKKIRSYLPAEWYPQSMIQLTWPHANSDWDYMLDDVVYCFVKLAEEISIRQKLLVVCEDSITTASLIKNGLIDNIIFAEVESDDTWARDHGAITIIDNGVPVLLDFGFNGWGAKFDAGLDNLINRKLYDMGIFNLNIPMRDMNHYILEGGSIESDGKGTMLTTRKCLLSVNRNDNKDILQIEEFLKNTFGLERILWLKHGHLTGDDTDSHIDTLARFCDVNTIAYVACENPTDEHFAELKLMEEELKLFTTLDHIPYKLVPLPMADPIYDIYNNRLPATYANFLIMNAAVLIPFYNSPKDQIAIQILRDVFPDKEVIGINCLPLIQQNGSLHCVTMQYPVGVI